LPALRALTINCPGGLAPPCDADQAGTNAAYQYHDIHISHRRLKVFELGMQAVQNMEFHGAILHQQTKSHFPK